MKKTSKTYAQADQQALSGSEQSGADREQAVNPNAQALWDIVHDLDDHVRHGYRQSGRPALSQMLPGQTRSGQTGQTGSGQMRSGQTGQTGSGQTGLELLREEVESCTLCDLHRKRNKAVPGTGDSGAGTSGCVQVMVVGEAPGREEDRLGLPFVGPAGQYLDKWLASIELSRDKGVYITNTVKCRPPENRDPRDDETRMCMPYLLRQIALLSPRAILCVGRISTSILLDRPVRISRERGTWFRFMNIPLIATYHPSAVLRNPELRRPVWEDLQKLRTALDSGTF